MGKSEGGGAKKRSTGKHSEGRETSRRGGGKVGGRKKGMAPGKKELFSGGCQTETWIEKKRDIKKREGREQDGRRRPESQGSQERIIFKAEGLLLAKQSLTRRR